MNGLIARVSALPYKSIVFHTNFVSAVAGAINPYMALVKVRMDSFITYYYSIRYN